MVKGKLAAILVLATALTALPVLGFAGKDYPAGPLKILSPVEQAAGTVADVVGQPTRGADRVNLEKARDHTKALRDGKAYPNFKYDSFGMKAKMVWGGMKGALCYPEQVVVDRFLRGAIPNLLTLHSKKNFGPGLWETGKVSALAWESDLGNLLKLCGAVAGPIAAWNGVLVAGNSAGSALNTFTFTMITAGGGQAVGQSIDGLRK